MRFAARVIMAGKCQKEVNNDIFNILMLERERERETREAAHLLNNKCSSVAATEHFIYCRQ